MLVSGQRMADGGVLSRAQFFDIRPESTVSDTLVMRQDNKGVQVIGNFNSENTYTDLASGAEKSVLSTTGRGYYVIGLLTPNHEPTNHALRDIAAVAPEFEKWGRGMILLSGRPSGRRTLRLVAASRTTLDRQLWNRHRRKDRSGDHRQPQAVDYRTSRVHYRRHVQPHRVCQPGYTIGLGDQIVDTIHHLGE